MSTTAKQQTDKNVPPAARQYEVGGKKYIVTSSTKAGAKEDAGAILRRLIKKASLFAPLLPAGM